MKALNFSWARAILLASPLLMLQACDKSNEPGEQGTVEFMITDAPSDDADIKGVFVTVTDLKVDGNSVPGFSKQTIDLKAYQAGNTQLLGVAHLNPRTYSNLTLVLDTDADAIGNAPGCYVLTNDDAKYKLRTDGTVEIMMSKAWTVVSNTQSRIVIDFDLRKSIRTISDQSIRYNLVSNENLIAAVRLVSTDKAGMVSGNYSEQFSSNADKVIVYAYKKGSFNADTETQAAGNDAIFFKNAIASAEVKETVNTKTFLIAFLEEGDYELHFAAYNKSATGNNFVFKNLLKSELTANGTLGSFITQSMAG